MLASMKSLKALDLRGTNVTAAGVAKLQAALPSCKIESGQAPAADDSDSDLFEPAEAASAATGSTAAAAPRKIDFPDIKTERELAEWTLRVGGQVNAGYSGAKRGGATAEQIAAKDFKLNAVRYDKIEAIDDDAIAHMVRWPLPPTIGLQGTGITDAGLRHLAALKHDPLALDVSAPPGHRRGVRCVRRANVQ